MEADKLCATDQRIADRNVYRCRLINLVRLNPILWDKKSPDFNQRVAKIHKWIEVAEQLGVSTDKMRRTWENLRDQYRRDLKRSITTGARSKWRFFHDMNFIRSMVRIKGSNHHRQSDSESDYEELTNDNYKETFSVTNMYSHSSLPITATLPTTTPTTTTTNNSNDNEPKEFLPIKLNTEWKQRAALEQLQQKQQQATLEQQQLTPTVQQQQQQYDEAQPQQDCDSSEEQKYDDEVYEGELSDQTNVIKIEIDSDSNDESLFDILQQQQQPPHPQPLKLQSQQQQQQQEPSREPRPSAPRPAELTKHESEEFVSTSVGAIKSRKRRLSTQTDATAEDHYQNCSHAQRQSIAADSELQDEDYHFVMSILPALRQVTRLRKFPLRSQIMGLISKELEESND